MTEMFQGVGGKRFVAVSTVDGSHPVEGETPVVFMHPFYMEYDTEVDRDYLRAVIPYRRKRGHFFINHQGPIVVFESYKDVERTAERVLKMRGPSQLYFVKTKDADPNPLGFGWKEANDFLRLFGNKVQVAGGKLREAQLLRHRGCLGYAIDALENSGFSVDVLDGLTFSYKESL